MIRGPDATEAQSFAGHSLVCPTRFVGNAADALEHPDTKKLMKGLAFYWVKGHPPNSFANAGVLPLPAKEPVRKSHFAAPWEMFPNVVFDAWRAQNDPEALATERAKNKEEGEQLAKKEGADLAARERIDLTRVVPFPKPKKEREPMDVVRGFIAAMHQWERECGRIDRKEGAAAALGINRPALQRIFDEFCTPKERKYGRLGSYSDPPEYDPADETILGVKPIGPRRAEVETERHTGLEKGRRDYVLLTKGGEWLIDSNKVRGGEPGIL